MTFIGLFTIIISCFGLVTCNINWNGNNWAHRCDFRGNDLSNAQVPGHECGGKCAQTNGCTHFTWTTYLGGTCWMKTGPVSKNHAFTISDRTAVCGIIVVNDDRVNWNGKNWAMSCDFRGNDFQDVRVSSSNCGGTCATTSGCTHFTWTTYLGGTCWMKSGPISKNDAFPTGDPNMVCGVMGYDLSISDSGTEVSGVLATRHGAHEPGACALPVASYGVVYPVALGDIRALKHLKFRPELCGHVLKVDCGNGPLDIIVTNSNLGGGLDLYASTWSKLTNNKPPGETSCTAQLTSRNALNRNGPHCYYKPGTDFGNHYYHNVGLLNTNGRIVSRATIDNRAGEHRGANPYFAFDFGPIDGNKQVVFTFEDGSTHSVFLRDCEYQQNEQLWS